ncbi:MAG: hypothetical protein HUJ26_00170 [Planctomycetaceae bacterium]|nr:hypothetical protein [Planctomycetaceae bacterium]
MSIISRAKPSLFDICNERCQSSPEAAEWLHDAMLAHESFSLAYHLYSLGFSLLPLNGKRPCRKWKALQSAAD